MIFGRYDEYIHEDGVELSGDGVNLGKFEAFLVKKDEFCAKMSQKLSFWTISRPKTGLEAHL
jgi:hypothetical protein